MVSSDQRCPTCYASARLVRDANGITRAPADLPDLVGSIGLCAICGLPAVWLASGQLRRISLAELGALRPEIGRAFEAARASMRLFATYTYELTKP